MLRWSCRWGCSGSSTGLPHHRHHHSSRCSQMADRVQDRWSGSSAGRSFACTPNIHQLEHKEGQNKWCNKVFEVLTSFLPLWREPTKKKRSSTRLTWNLILPAMMMMVGLTGKVRFAFTSTVFTIRKNTNSRWKLLRATWFNALAPPTLLTSNRPSEKAKHLSMKPRDEDDSQLSSKCLPYPSDLLWAQNYANNSETARPKTEHQVTSTHKHTLHDNYG